MAAKRNRLAAARKYLNVFEESWKADHHQAMQCKDFEESLGEAIKVFQLVNELVLSRRESVYRGLAEVNTQLDEEEKLLYTDWLALTEKDLVQLAAFEKTFALVEGGVDFRNCCDQARLFLANGPPRFPPRR